MKRFALAALFVTSALAASLPARAATQLEPTFNVNIGLTTGCVISTAPGDVAFAYVFNQALAQPLTANGSFGVRCSKNLDYTLALDGTGTYTDDATDLIYSLTLSKTSETGSGAAQAFTITGSMAANQSGTCAASAVSCNNSGATNKTRTLTVSY